MPDSTHDIFDQREAVHWVMRFDPDYGGGVDLETMPALEPAQLIYFVGILRRLGHPDAIRADVEAIGRTREVLHRTVRAKEDQKPVEEALDQLRNWRACELRAAEAAVVLLKREGWEYDPQLERLKRIPGIAGGRPGHLLTDLAGFFWEAYRPEYRDATGDASHNSGGLREELAFRMSAFLPAHDIDPRPKGPLDNAIRSYLIRREEGPTGADRP